MQLLIKIIYIFGLAGIFIFLMLQLIFGGYYLYKPISEILGNNKLKWEKRVAEIKWVELESLPNPNMPEGASMVFPIEECKIEYVFEYNGKYYTDSNIGLHQEKEYQSKFQQELYMKLKKMNNVIVYVNPKNPKQSAIIKYDINLKNVGAGIALLIFPLLVINWVYIGQKHPLNYLADKIKIIP